MTSLTTTGATILTGVTNTGGLTSSGLSTLGPTTVTSFTATGASTLATVSAGATTVGTLSAGATTVTTLSAGATTVAGLTAAATTLTTLNVTGDTTIDTLSATGNIYTSGNINVSGNITKGSGSFVIPHPDSVKAASNIYLKHCFVEAPTRGENIYRFTVITQNLNAIIELPSYFSYINENVQGWVNAIDVFAFGTCLISSDLQTATINVSADGTFNVLIIGTRSDQLARTHFDDKGGVEFLKYW